MVLDTVTHILWMVGVALGGMLVVYPTAMLIGGWKANVQDPDNNEDLRAQLFVGFLLLIWLWF